MLGVLCETSRNWGAKVLFLSDDLKLVHSGYFKQLVSDCDISQVNIAVQRRSLTILCSGCICVSGEPEMIYNHTLLLLKLRRTSEACRIWREYRGITDSCQPPLDRLGNSPFSHLSWPSPCAEPAIISFIQYFRCCAMSSVSWYFFMSPCMLSLHLFFHSTSAPSPGNF